MLPKKYQFKGIFIFKHPEEALPEIKCMNLSARSSICAGITEQELETIISSEQHDHIVYISRITDKQISIKIIDSDTTPLLDYNYIVYPK